MRAFAALLFSGVTACGGAPRRFERLEVVWRDPDRHPIAPPEETWSPMVWDAADHIVFRPLTRVFLLEPAPPARNANALGEVPDSSWYTNRLALGPLDPETIARGPCEGETPDPPFWIVRSGKTEGANPGFFVEDGSSGRRYVFKFDSSDQSERATSADVIGSKVYWAAGFSTPCNRIVYFDPAALRLDPGAKNEDSRGRETPLTRADVEHAMRGAPRRDGRVRASASLLLPGEPLGPFEYVGTRGDDPNDVVPHEDRRELRGSRLLAAWLNHFDARAANTLTTFVRDAGSELGWVQHHLLDFGDCLGSRWPWDGVSRRLGHSYYFDPEHVAVDFVTLGAIERPWDRVRVTDEGDIFGYFDVATFDPAAWRAGYPNVAFDRMDAADAFWAAKLVGRFSDAAIRRLVEEAQLSSPTHARYLERVLVGRRDAIVRTYLEPLSALDTPVVAGERLCADDLLVTAGHAEAADAFYDWRRAGAAWAPVRAEKGVVCVDVPERGAAYEVIELRVRRTHQRDPARALRVHLRRVDGAGAMVVGLER